MIKTIQSGSYRGYTKSLVSAWIDHFGKVKNENFLFENLHRCLEEFSVFALDFTTEAETISSKDKTFQSLDSKGKVNHKKWLDEKISKALDVYWSPLSQAATQYSAPAYTERVTALTDLQPTIEIYLDRLNQLAGTSIRERITIENVILYFDELTLIRLAPYSKKALIGVPFRAFESATSSGEEKLSSIAHELGHFLYWRLAPFNQIDTKHQEIIDFISESLGSKSGDKDRREVRFIRAWFEEFFADFVGSKIAGNSYVESCKEMIRRNNKSSLELGENDQEHVADILRPLPCIYTVDQNRDSSLTAWKKFFDEDFPVDMTTIEIETGRENDDQRDIKRSPDKLSQILMDTIDILSEKVGRESRIFFQSTFVDVSNASQVSNKAYRLETKDPVGSTDTVTTALDIFLEPQILEAGKQKHKHTWTTYSPHYHQETRSHSK